MLRRLWPRGEEGTRPSLSPQGACSMQQHAFRAGSRDFDVALREHGLSVLRLCSEVQPTVAAPEGRYSSASLFRGRPLGGA